MEKNVIEKGPTKEEIGNQRLNKFINNFPEQVAENLRSNLLRRFNEGELTREGVLKVVNEQIEMALNTIQAIKDKYKE